jgi:hypothetical protein
MYGIVAGADASYPNQVVFLNRTYASGDSPTNLHLSVAEL